MNLIQTISTGTGSLLTLSDAKNHLRVNISDDDALITSYITAAQEYVQQETGIRFYADTYLETGPCFPFNPSRLELMRYPVTSVSWIKYYDGNNALQTLDPSKYYVQLPTNAKAWIEPIWSNALGFPPTYYRPDAAQVQYVTGVAPNPLAVQAARLLVGGMYLYREGEVQAMPREIVFGVTNLLQKIARKGYA